MGNKETHRPGAKPDSKGKLPVKPQKPEVKVVVPERTSLPEIIELIKSNIDKDKVAAFQVPEQGVEAILNSVIGSMSTPEGVGIQKIIESRFRIVGKGAENHLKVQAGKRGFPSLTVTLDCKFANTQDERDIRLSEVASEPQRIKFWPIIDVDIEKEIKKRFEERPVHLVLKGALQEELDKGKGPRYQIKGIRLHFDEHQKLQIRVSGSKTQPSNPLPKAK